MLYPNPYGWNLFVKQKVIEGELQKKKVSNGGWCGGGGHIVYVKKICFN
jgi:hypothetical protein